MSFWAEKLNKKREEDEWNRQANAPLSPVAEEAITAGLTPPLVPQTSSGFASGKNIPPTAPAVSPVPPTAPAVPDEYKAVGYTPEVPNPEKAKERSSKLLQGQWGAVEREEKKAEDELPAYLRSLYKDDLEEIKAAKTNLVAELKSDMERNLTSYEANKRKAEIAEILQTVMLASVRLAAGIHGYRTGKDYTTGLEFNPKDWSSEMAALRDELRTKNDMLKEYHKGAMDIQEAKEKEVLGMRREEGELAVQSWKDRLQALRQRAVETEKGIVRTEEQRASEVTDARKFAASEKNRFTLAKAQQEAEASRQQAGIQREERLLKAEEDKARRQEIKNYEASKESDNLALSKTLKEVQEKPSEAAIAGLGLQLTKMGLPEATVNEVLSQGRSTKWGFWKTDGTLSQEGGTKIGALVKQLQDAQDAQFYGSRPTQAPSQPAGALKPIKLTDGTPALMDPTTRTVYSTEVGPDGRRKVLGKGK